MAIQRKEEASSPAASDTRVPPPVEGGIEHLESLGRVIDNLMGDALMRRNVRRRLEPHFLKDHEMPEDPPPSEAPPPVADGLDVV